MKTDSKRSTISRHLKGGYHSHNNLRYNKHMRLYNTATHTIEEFQPIHPPSVSLYTCGPTVYDFTHLGHMRKYTNDDVLKQTLVYLGYTVNHVMNITDVGHLSSDADSGIDKMEKGAEKAGKSVWEVAQFYTDFFFKTMDALHISRPSTVCKATDHVTKMVQLITQLQKNGHVYETPQALYFDISTFPAYGTLSGQKLDEKKQAVREAVVEDPDKKHPADFALWFKRVGRFANHTMHWESPWGDGFPGWHIECSAMSMEYLGPTIDIHTGGTEHIAIHHENEIAQSEGATGKPFVHYWVHNEMLQIDGKKMSKSSGNFYTISDITEKGIDLIALKLLFYQTHYRQPMNFTWNAAYGADEAYRKLKIFITEHPTASTTLSPKARTYQKQFAQAVAHDVQMPQAIATMWEMLKSEILPEDKTALLYNFDQVLRLALSDIQPTKIPTEIQQLITERDMKRNAKDFAGADAIRSIIESKGYRVKDTNNGTAVEKV